MYTVAKGPTNLLQKSRLGLKNLEQENGQKYDQTDKPGQLNPADRLGQFAEMPQFQSLESRKTESPDSRKKSKRRGKGKDTVDETSSTPPPLKETPSPAQQIQETEQYRELVSFLDQSWNQIRTELDTDCESVNYYEQPENAHYTDFQPFNLDVWMEQKIYNSIMAGL